MLKVMKDYVIPHNYVMSLFSKNKPFSSWEKISNITRLPPDLKVLPILLLSTCQKKTSHDQISCFVLQKTVSVFRCHFKNEFRRIQSSNSRFGDESGVWGKISFLDSQHQLSWSHEKWSGNKQYINKQLASQ